MLGELLAWFTGKEVNRRKFPRKRKPFHATYSIDGGTSRRPAIGLDIGGGGMCIITQEDPGRDEFDLTALIEQRTLRMRAKIVWRDKVNHQGKTVHRMGMRFTGIPADDWDAIVRYTTDRPVSDQNKLQEELEAVRMTPDETDRLVPQALQQRLLTMLVQRRRLAPLNPKQTPLVAYFYGGVSRHNGSPYHRLTIQSKVVLDDGSDEHFETRFMFDDRGEQVTMLN
ncbi:MAG TPA: PilZ domain-containing protein [Candidatus Dormibacteraeota bacterium]|nr:PilZ domain-containing protein [Candidatus Dormibacteraeota bacterium]